MNITTLLDSFPDAIVSIKLADLMAANKELIRLAKEDLREALIEEQAGKLVSRKEAQALLGVCSATLWGWKKKGVLQPVEMGGRDMYRVKDINRMKGGRQ